MSAFEQQTRSLYEAIQRLTQALKSAETQRIRAWQEKLNHSDVLAVQCIGERGTCILNEVASHLHVSPTTASTIIDRLVRKDLVSRRRSEANRRIVELRLTESGQALHDELADLLMRQCAIMLRAVPESDRDRFVLDVNWIAENASQQNESRAPDSPDQASTKTEGPD